MPRTLRSRLQTPAMASSEPLGLAAGSMRAVGRAVAKDDLIVALEVGERGGVANVIAVGMRDGHAQDLAGVERPK